MASRDCPICVGRDEHSLVNCEAISRMGPQKRRTLVTLLKRCFLCLAAEHLSRECKGDYKCAKCGGMHHDLIHLDNFTPGSRPSRSNFESGQLFNEDDPYRAEEESVGHRATPTMVARPNVPDSSEYSLRFCTAKTGLSLIHI